MGLVGDKNAVEDDIHVVDYSSKFESHLNVGDGWPCLSAKEDQQ